MKDQLLFSAISTDNISYLYKKDLQVSVLRLDKIHPLISGNKWFKLQFYIDQAIAQHKTKLLTFGGAWSNHIVATAAYCRLKGLTAVGIIRGEEPANWSPALLKAQQDGMQLIFISREQYTRKEIPGFFSEDEYYLIPEGGYGEPGASGAAAILDYADGLFTHYCCAVGTGTTMAGLINAAPSGSIVTGISVLKNNLDLEENIRVLTHNRKNWELLHQYHFGGYAKYQPALISFMNEFFRQTEIPSDFVYTGKLFYAVADLIANNHFPAGSRLLLIHSGGLQGNISLPSGTLIF